MGRLFYKIGKGSESEHHTLDFIDGISRTVEERIEFGLIVMKLPIVDDAPYRIFQTMEDYRRWAEISLPGYLGYYRKKAAPRRAGR